MWIVYIVGAIVLAQLFLIARCRANFVVAALASYEAI